MFRTSWTNSTHEAYYKRDISQRLKPLTDYSNCVQDLRLPYTRSQY